ncbi:formate/nitrite transporter family protein [Kiloniella sp. b19]|uniref:formate/nitrite transporter family protein n=1 Tax=Kiloniella sp. GXU_MW_B19 TaxID=3141326 RepID=UPI0031D47336
MQNSMLSGFDSFSPSEIAHKVEALGVTKARTAWPALMMLSMLAGAFIAFGGAFYTTTITGSTLGFGMTKMLGGITFSTGLILVVVGGAELFTGNNMIVMAWVSRKVSLQDMLKNWVLVYLGNFIGAAGVLAMMVLSGILDGPVAETAIKVAEGKLKLSTSEAFVRGILCNTLVCMAVWLCSSARNVFGKILAIVFPVSAFITLGFEHSIANMYLIPVGYFAGSEIVTLSGFLHNLVPVTLGNIIGGSLFVALSYWIIYLRKV